MTTEQFIQHAHNTLAGVVVNNKTYGQGIIKDCYLNPALDLMVNIEFANNLTKGFALQIAMTFRTIKFLDDANLTQAKELLNELNPLKVQRAQEAVLEREQELEAMRQKVEQEKQAAKDKKKEEQFERAKETAIARFKSMRNNTYAITSAQDEYYYTIGWLAKNVRTISARLPDYLEPVFASHFGASAPRTVTDTSRKTVGGFKPQWSYAFTASIKNIDVAPALVLEKLNEARTKLADTAFIWNLIDNHNFKFGKEQDVDAIRKNIPECYLESFDNGFNAVD